MKNKTHGGARKGSGRKKKEPTDVIRIRTSIVPLAKKLNKEKDVSKLEEVNSLLESKMK